MKYNIKLLFIYIILYILHSLGLSSEKGKLMSKIVLSGDPRQLKPVTKSMFAAQRGFKRSFMEYLFTQKCYKPNESGQFDAKLIVQIVQNYRNLPNDLVYENRLQAKKAKSNCIILKLTIFHNILQNKQTYGNIFQKKLIGLLAQIYLKIQMSQ